jgi:hypothetical protein
LASGRKQRQHMAKQWEELTREEVFTYDTKKYDFRSIVQKMLHFDDLERIHTLYPEYTKPGVVQFENDQHTPIHKNFYNSSLLPQFEELYRSFVRDIISPMFNEPSIVYQTRPTFRVHLPNNVAVGKKHRDADYNHPAGEINFWVPLTQVWGNNGFWVESTPDKGDFHPIGSMNYGDVFRFYGNKCQHYNNINDTGSTRISFDFRVIPYSKYTPSHATSVKSKMKFEIGSYYSIMTRSE